MALSGRIPLKAAKAPKPRLRNPKIRKPLTASSFRSYNQPESPKPNSRSLDTAGIEANVLKLLVREPLLLVSPGSGVHFKGLV